MLTVSSRPPSVYCDPVPEFPREPSTEADRRWWAAESARMADLAELRAYYDAIRFRDFDDERGSGLAFPDEIGGAL